MDHCFPASHFELGIGTRRPDSASERQMRDHRWCCGVKHKKLFYSGVVDEERRGDDAGREREEKEEKEMVAIYEEKISLGAE